jgi:hypothetical protein
MKERVRKSDKVTKRIREREREREREIFTRVCVFENSSADEKFEEFLNKYIIIVLDSLKKDRSRLVSAVDTPRFTFFALATILP